MSGLYWPGDERAGETFTGAALVHAMIAVEAAWLHALAEHDIAPSPPVRDPLAGLEPAAGDLVALSAVAEDAGNPVAGFVTWLRAKIHDSETSRWLHRGLTSQDVLDTAVMVQAKQLVADLRTEVVQQVGSLTAHAQDHRHTDMIGRTLTQPAVPITFGGKVASWLQGLLDAADDLDKLKLPAHIIIKKINRSGVIALGGDPSALAGTAAGRLGLLASPPWHTARAPITRLGTALTAYTSSCGRIANDVLTLSRPEIGELAEPSAPGRGGSSAMPQKVNPVLSMLIRRAALAAPAYSSLLHLAAADMSDERAAGAWQLEWEPLRLLARHTLTAARHTSELLAGLRVKPQEMAATLDTFRDDVSGEYRSLAPMADRPATKPHGDDSALIDSALDRARRWRAKGQA